MPGGSPKNGKDTPQKPPPRSPPAPASPGDVTGKPASAASQKESTTVARDPRLLTFLERSEIFFERALEILPAGEREAMTSQMRIRSADGTKGQASEDPPLDLKQSFRKECESLASAAAHLPLLDQTFSTAWPAAVRYMLPSKEPGISIEQTWSPALAWIVLSSLPCPGMSAAIFDRLQLRCHACRNLLSLEWKGTRLGELLQSKSSAFAR